MSEIVAHISNLYLILVYDKFKV